MTRSPRGSLESLNEDILRCAKCPRLRAYCKEIAQTKRASFRDQTYWAQPVPNFGPLQGPARLLIVGLAPAAHGGNRTGRMFTGDRSGQWLYRALRKWNFSNQSTFEESNDGLILRDCLITTVAHCAPPENKPTREEMANCQPFLARTLELTRPKVILALGQIAWRSIFKELIRLEIWQGKVPDFRHGMETTLDGDRLLVLASYHPSQQNTFTGVLTEPMFDQVFRQAREFMDKTT